MSARTYLSAAATILLFATTEAEDAGCAVPWAQCGGKNFQAADIPIKECCKPEQHCEGGEWYKQCVDNPNHAATRPPPTPQPTKSPTPQPTKSPTPQPTKSSASAPTPEFDRTYDKRSTLGLDALTTYQSTVEAGAKSDDQANQRKGKGLGAGAVVAIVIAILVFVALGAALAHRQFRRLGMLKAASWKSTETQNQHLLHNDVCAIQA